MKFKIGDTVYSPSYPESYLKITGIQTYAEFCIRQNQKVNNFYPVDKKLLTVRSYLIKNKKPDPHQRQQFDLWEEACEPYTLPHRGHRLTNIFK